MKRKREFVDAVLQRLDGLPILSPDVSEDGGKITLAGYAKDHASRIAAEEAVRQICGVGSVANRIAIEPVLRREHYTCTSEEFREQVRRRILASLPSETVAA